MTLLTHNMKCFGVLVVKYTSGDGKTPIQPLLEGKNETVSVNHTVQRTIQERSHAVSKTPHATKNPAPK